MSHDNSAPLDLDSFRKQWKSLVAKYQKPSWWRAGWQVVNTMVPYLALLGIMYWSMSFSYLLTAALVLPASGFLVRIFIISHDCGHGSFFESKRANDIVGSITSFFCLTPYAYWRHEHALHHASTGNLDRRGHGDIWTLTVQEYLAAPRRTQFAYRLYRNPIVLFLIGASFVFLLEYRMPPRKGTRADRLSVWRMNFALVAFVAIICMTVGWQWLVFVQLPVFCIAATAGAWLFYVQHQFEDVYWSHDENWDFVDGCMKGSSYYHLPKVLQWFTGNIGFHHIHHLSSKIPNYRLEACHKENEPFQQAYQLSLWSSFKCLRYRLWDAENKKLLTFRQVHKLRLAREAS